MKKNDNPSRNSYPLEIYKKTKEKQELIVDEHSYPIYQGNFRRNEETNNLILSISLRIPAYNIAFISPWIMQQIGKNITIVRHLSKDGRPFNTIYMEFIGVRCTGFHEEFDKVHEQVVLNFTVSFEDRIITDEGGQRKITQLLA